MNEVKEALHRLSKTKEVNTFPFFRGKKEEAGRCIHGSYDKENCKVCTRPELQLSSQKKCEACERLFYSPNTKTMYCYLCSCNQKRIQKFKAKKEFNKSL